MFLLKLVFFVMMASSSLDFYAMDSGSFGMFEDDASKAVAPILTAQLIDQSAAVRIVRFNQNVKSQVDDLANNLENTSLVPRRKVKAVRQFDQSCKDSQEKLLNSLIIGIGLSVGSSPRPFNSPIPMLKRGFESSDSDDAVSLKSIDDSRCSRQKRLEDFSFLPVRFVEQSGRRSQSL